MSSSAAAWASPAPLRRPDSQCQRLHPLNPADYTANRGRWYAFAGPAGVVCILDNLNGDYGCSGALPGAPEGVNLVSGDRTVRRPSPPPRSRLFAAASRPAASAEHRLSYRSVSCGVDDAGAVACFNSRDQVGFVVGPNGTYINASNLCWIARRAPTRCCPGCRRAKTKPRQNLPRQNPPNQNGCRRPRGRASWAIRPR